MNDPSTRPISVILADHHRMTWSPIKRTTPKSSGIKFVACVGNGVRALEETLLRKPDVVVMDLWLPAMSGLEAARKIRTASETKVLFLTVDSEVAVWVECIRGPANGMLSKGSRHRLLIEGIQRVASGEQFIDPRFRDVVLARMSIKHNDLTARETEITHLVGLGMSNEAIGEKLSVSSETVRTHVGNIVHKLGIKDRLALALWALRRGLVTIDELRNL